MKIPLTEVIVPKELIWWTYVGLRSRREKELGKIRFLCRPTGQADRVIVDSRLLRPLLPWTAPSVTVVVLLWNGYESYLEFCREILAMCDDAERLEIRVVGDLWTSDDSEAQLPRISHLFGQNLSLYRWSLLRSGNAGTISFSIDSRGLWIKCRSLLISGKVLLQLLMRGRFCEYLTKRYVFCGQSGLHTLKRYARQYCVGEYTASIPGDGLGCSQAFIQRWCEALQHSERDWSWKVTARALLRLIALRVLLKVRGDALFLHLHPRRNLNAYQAGLLFTDHVFLDFGGIHGDELVYPRAADLAILGRKVLKFDTHAALEKLRHLQTCDQELHARFVREYEEEVIARFDACPLDPSPWGYGRSLW